MITRRTAIFSLFPLTSAMQRVGAADQETEMIRGLVKLPADSGGIIQLPIRFHIIRGADMSKKGVRMNMWLTPEEVEQTVLPEITPRQGNPDRI